MNICDGVCGLSRQAEHSLAVRVVHQQTTFEAADIIKSDRHEQPSQQTVKKQMVPVLFLRSFAGCIMKQSNSLLQPDYNPLFRNNPSGCPLNPINPWNNTRIHSNSSTNLLMLHKENQDFDIFHFHLYYPMTSITPVLLSAISDCFGQMQPRGKKQKKQKQCK